MRSAISGGLADRIEQWMHDERLPAGHALIERALGERFRVSRSPVRDALQLLEQRGAVRRRSGGGFEVARLRRARSGNGTAPVNPDEAVYLQIARDRLTGTLPERVAENELMRRYPISRVRLVGLLRRAADEGWAERLPGHGWHFPEVLTSPRAYDEGYRLRIVLEPAGLLEPTFEPDEAALRRCHDEQQALVGTGAMRVSPAHIFDANVRLHETVARLSGNRFIVDALQRVNRLRRLTEYGLAVDRAVTVRRSREHLHLIELLLRGQREAASRYLLAHLSRAAHEKAGGVPARPAGARPLSRG